MHQFGTWYHIDAFFGRWLSRGGWGRTIVVLMGAVTLSGLNVYPVKSAAGIALTVARVDRRGLAGDRRWMVVDENRAFLSQRTHPRLALISVVPGPGRLVLSGPGMPPLAVASPPRGVTLPVRVWDDLCDAVSAGDRAARWFSKFLGFSCALVFLPERSHRRVAARWTAPAAEVGFADAFPFLLISEASLGDLNRRLAHPLPMSRFRPNLVVRGCLPYAEDGWRRVRIGGVLFHVVKPCGRCAITTVDQATGDRGREPLATLATYRRSDGRLLFGQNLVHEGTGVIRVGDEATVVETA